MVVAAGLVVVVGSFVTPRDTPTVDARALLHCAVVRGWDRFLSNWFA